jgi:hypothetical protein
MLRDQATHNAVKIMFEYPTAPDFVHFIDSIRVKMILVYLISNAIIYSKADSLVKVVLNFF